MTTGHDGAGQQATLSRAPRPAVPRGRRLADDIGSARDGAVRLIRTGQQRIGFIAGTVELLPSAERVHGYTRALRNGALTFDSSLADMAASTEHGPIPAEHACPRPALTTPGSGEIGP